jgi:adenylate cyclase
MNHTRTLWLDRAAEPGPFNLDAIVSRRQIHFGKAMVDEICFIGDTSSSPRYIKSPFYRVDQDGELYEPILPAGEEQKFAVFDELAALGCTGYFATSLGEFSGVRKYVALSTDRPGGFSGRQLDGLRRSLGLLSLHVRALVECEIKTTLARVYIGRDPGERVCRGMIRAGDVIGIDAAIWFSDLRGFTSRSEGVTAEQLLLDLNEYFECVAGAIYDQGGEVLKYIGDAVLAVFPTDTHGDRTMACAAALGAVTECAVRLDRLNGERAAGGDQPFVHGIALHAGEVRYGNIGSRERLDFTVIGREVNIASRIEGLCKTLGETVLCSAKFAKEISVAARPLGQFELKGVESAVEILAPAIPLANPALTSAN